MIAGDGQAISHISFCVKESSPLPRQHWHRCEDAFVEACQQLNAYFRQELTQFDLPLNPSGTAFQQRVWSALQTIPYGQTCSYAAIADAIDNPKACRAVGSANNANPITIVIPCHRVIGASGDLVGYGGGLPRKVKLLQLENAVCASARSLPPVQHSLF